MYQTAVIRLTGADCCTIASIGREPTIWLTATQFLRPVSAHRTPERPSLMDEQQCFARLAEGGTSAQRALTVLYDLNARKFLGFLHRRGFGRDDAEDIVQETFIKIAGLGSRAKDVKQARAYLWRTLTNCSHDWRRRQLNDPLERVDKPEDEDDPTGVAGIGDGSSAGQETDDFIDCLQGTLGVFEKENAEGAQAVELAVIEGFSGEELAEAIGRNYGAARQFLSQCRKKFQALLLERCHDYMPEAMRADS